MTTQTGVAPAVSFGVAPSASEREHRFFMGMAVVIALIVLVRQLCDLETLELLAEIVACERGAQLAPREQRMIVHDAHGAAEHAVADRVVVALAAPVRRDEIMEVQGERRRAGLAGPHLPRHVEVAPPR